MRFGHPVPVTVVRVQDGDSLIVHPVNSGPGTQVRLRLCAIDAPERDQLYGREARNYLYSLVEDRTDLLLEPSDSDRYGRLVGVLYYRSFGRGRSVNRIMVEQGFARWYRNYDVRGLGLEQAERSARSRRRGIWSGDSVAPWEYRKAKRDPVRGGSLKWVLLGGAIAALFAVAYLWAGSS